MSNFDDLLAATLAAHRERVARSLLTPNPLVAQLQRWEAERRARLTPWQRRREDLGRWLRRWRYRIAGRP